MDKDAGATKIGRADVFAKSPDDFDIAEAVRTLRKAFGETQEQFRERLDATVRTVTRYETTRPPKGEALVRLWRLAKKKGLDDVAAVFAQAFFRDFWASLEDSGFAAKLIEQLEEALKPRFNQRFGKEIAEKVLADMAVNQERQAANPKEREFLSGALKHYRRASSKERELLEEDFGAVLRKWRVMLEIEEKIKREMNPEGEQSG